MDEGTAQGGGDRWVKMPGPGQFRGEGEWKRVPCDGCSSHADWEWIENTGFLPTYRGASPFERSSLNPSPGERE